MRRVVRVFMGLWIAAAGSQAQGVGRNEEAYNPLAVGATWVYAGTFPSQQVAGMGSIPYLPDGTRMTYRSELSLEVTRRTTRGDSAFYTLEVKDSLYSRLWDGPASIPYSQGPLKPLPDSVHRETRTYLRVGGRTSRVLGRDSLGRPVLDTLDLFLYRPIQGLVETAVPSPLSSVQVKELKGAYQRPGGVTAEKWRRAWYMSTVGFYWGVDFAGCNTCGCFAALELRLLRHNGRAVDARVDPHAPLPKEAAEAKEACSIRRRSAGSARFRGGAVPAAYEVDLAGRITIVPEPAP